MNARPALLGRRECRSGKLFSILTDGGHRWHDRGFRLLALKALEAALEIIDSEGLKALSIRRLGEVMNVNGASLYHHFKDKDDILVGVAQLALADVTAPRSDSDNWRVWLPLNANRTRQAPSPSRAHPAHAAPDTARHW